MSIEPDKISDFLQCVCKCISKGMLVVNTAKLPDGRYTIYSVVYSSQEYFGGKLHLKIPTTGHKARLRVKIVNDKIVRVWSPLDSRRRRVVFIIALLFLYSAFLIARTHFGLWQ